jgi:hypothetical protein
MVWDRKWSVLIPALAAAVVTSITSYYVVPVRYQSEAFLEFIPVGTPDVRGDAGNHVTAMSAVLASSTRLERIIEDLNWRHPLRLRVVRAADLSVAQRLTQGAVRDGRPGVDAAHGLPDGLRDAKAFIAQRGGGGAPLKRRVEHSPRSRRKRSRGGTRPTTPSCRRARNCRRKSTTIATATSARSISGPRS